MRNNSGFIMADTLIALSMLSLIMLSLLTLSSNTRSVTRAANLELTAALIAQALLEGDAPDTPIMRDGVEYIYTKTIQSEDKPEWKKYSLQNTEVSVTWQGPKGKENFTLKKAVIVGIDD